ncbi:MAG: hypothetical protein IKQ29_02860 [Bacilli bacterium]|nr:hypothetical protein [Bacilli bacterium]
MRELRKRIWLERLEIAKNVSLIVVKTIGGTLGVIFEGIAKFSKYALLMRALNDEDIFDVELESLELFEDIPYHVENIGDSISEIKNLKRELREEKKKINQPVVPVIPSVELNDDILDYIRRLIERTSGLSVTEQKTFVKKLKEILADYTDKYMALLDRSAKSESVSLLKQKTFKKLEIIEKAIEQRIKVNSKKSSYTSEEEKVLSMIDSVEKDQEQKLTLKNDNK